MKKLNIQSSLYSKKLAFQRTLFSSKPTFKTKQLPKMISFRRCLDCLRKLLPVEYRRRSLSSEPLSDEILSRFQRFFFPKRCKFPENRVENWNRSLLPVFSSPETNHLSREIFFLKTSFSEQDSYLRDLFVEEASILRRPIPEEPNPPRTILP